MRRVGLLAALLVVVSLTSAFAASFDAQAEDIASFQTPVSISVPPPPTPPPLASAPFYLVGDPPAAGLSSVEPTTSGGNKKGAFIFTSDSITTEDRDPEPGDKVYWVSWSSEPLPSGLRFENQIVLFDFFRTTGSGELTAGLFDCPAIADPATLTADGCVLMTTGSGTGEQIQMTAFTRTINPGRELRLKMVNLTETSATIQWGYKEQNRSAQLVILAPGVTP